MTPSDKLNIIRDLKTLGYKGGFSSMLNALSPNIKTYKGIDMLKKELENLNISDPKIIKTGFTTLADETGEGLNLVASRGLNIPSEHKNNPTNLSMTTVLPWQKNENNPFKGVVEGKVGFPVGENTNLSLGYAHPIGQNKFDPSGLRLGIRKNFEKGGELIKTKSPQNIVGNVHQDRKHHTALMPGDTNQYTANVPNFANGGEVPTDPPKEKQSGDAKFYEREEFLDYNNYVSELAKNLVNDIIAEVSSPFYGAYSLNNPWTRNSGWADASMESVIGWRSDVLNNKSNLTLTDARIKNEQRSQEEIDNEVYRLYQERWPQLLDNDEKARELFDNSYQSALTNVISEAQAVHFQDNQIANAERDARNAEITKEYNIQQEQSEDDFQNITFKQDANVPRVQIPSEYTDIASKIDLTDYQDKERNTRMIHLQQGFLNDGGENYDDIQEQVNSADIGSVAYWNYLENNLPQEAVQEWRGIAEDRIYNWGMEQAGQRADEAIVQNEKRMENFWNPDAETLRNIGYDALVHPWTYIKGAYQGENAMQTYESGVQGQRNFEAFDLLPFAAAGPLAPLSWAPKIDMWSHIIPSGLNAGAWLGSSFFGIDGTDLGLYKPTTMDYLNLGFTALGGRGVLNKGKKAYNTIKKLNRGEDATVDIFNEVNPSALTWENPSWTSRWGQRLRGETPGKQFNISEELEAFKTANPTAGPVEIAAEVKRLTTQPTFTGYMFPNTNARIGFGAGKGKLTLGGEGLYDANIFGQQIYQGGNKLFDYDVRKQVGHEGFAGNTGNFLRSQPGYQPFYKGTFDPILEESFAGAAEQTGNVQARIGSVGYDNFVNTLNEGIPPVLKEETAAIKKQQTAKEKPKPNLLEKIVDKISAKGPDEMLIQDQIYEFPGMTEEQIVTSTRDLMNRYPRELYEQQRSQLPQQPGSGAHVTYEQFINGQLRYKYPAAHFTFPGNEVGIKGRTSAMKNFIYNRPYNKDAVQQELEFNRIHGLDDPNLLSADEIAAAGLYNYGFNKPLNQKIGSLYSLNPESPSLFLPWTQSLQSGVNKGSLVQDLNVGRRFFDYELAPGTVYTPKGQGKGFSLNTDPMWSSDLKEGQMIRSGQPFFSTSKGTGLADITPEGTGLGTETGGKLFGDNTMKIHLPSGSNVLHYNTPSLTNVNRFSNENEILLGNEGMFKVQSDFGQGTEGFDINLKYQPAPKQKRNTTGKVDYGTLQNVALGAGSAGAMVYDYLTEGDGEAFAAGLFGLIGGKGKGKKKGKTKTGKGPGKKAGVTNPYTNMTPLEIMQDAQIAPEQIIKNIEKAAQSANKVTIDGKDFVEITNPYTKEKMQIPAEEYETGFGAETGTPGIDKITQRARQEQWKVEEGINPEEKLVEITDPYSGETMMVPESEVVHGYEEEPVEELTEFEKQQKQQLEEEQAGIQEAEADLEKKEAQRKKGGKKFGEGFFNMLPYGMGTSLGLYELLNDNPEAAVEAMLFGLMGKRRGGKRGGKGGKKSRITPNNTGNRIQQQVEKVEIPLMDGIKQDYFILEDYMSGGSINFEDPNTLEKIKKQRQHLDDLAEKRRNAKNEYVNSKNFRNVDGEHQIIYDFNKVLENNPVDFYGVNDADKVKSVENLIKGYDKFARKNKRNKNSFAREHKVEIDGLMSYIKEDLKNLQFYTKIIADHEHLGEEALYEAYQNKKDIEHKLQNNVNNLQLYTSRYQRDLYWEDKGKELGYHFTRRGNNFKEDVPITYKNTGKEIRQSFEGNILDNERINGHPLYNFGDDVSNRLKELENKGLQDSEEYMELIQLSQHLPQWIESAYNFTTSMDADNFFMQQLIERGIENPESEYAYIPLNKSELPIVQKYGLFGQKTIGNKNTPYHISTISPNTAPIGKPLSHYTEASMEAELMDKSQQFRQTGIMPEEGQGEVIRISNKPFSGGDPYKGGSDKRFSGGDIEYYNRVTEQWEPLPDQDFTGSESEKYKTTLETEVEQIPELSGSRVKIMDILTGKANKNINLTKKDITGLEQNLKDLETNYIEKTEPIRDLISKKEAQLYGETAPEYLALVSKYPQFTGYLLNEGLITRFESLEKPLNVSDKAKTVIDKFGDDKYDNIGNEIPVSTSTQDKQSFAQMNAENLVNALNDEELVNKFIQSQLKSRRGVSFEEHPGEETIVNALITKEFGQGQRGKGIYTSNSPTVAGAFSTYKNIGSVGNIRINAPELEGLSPIEKLDKLNFLFPSVNSPVTKEHVEEMVNNVQNDNKLSDGDKQRLTKLIKTFEGQDFQNINQDYYSPEGQDYATKLGTPLSKTLNINPNLPQNTLGTNILSNYSSVAAIEAPYSYGGEKHVYFEPSERVILDENRVFLEDFVEFDNNQTVPMDALGPRNKHSIDESLFKFVNNKKLKKALTPILTSQEEGLNILEEIEELKNQSDKLFSEEQQRKGQGYNVKIKLEEELESYENRVRYVRQRVKNLLINAGVLAGLGGAGYLGGVGFEHWKEWDKERMEKRNNIRKRKKEREKIAIKD